MLRIFVAKILQQAPDVQNDVLLAYQRKSLITSGDGFEWEAGELKKMLSTLLKSHHSSMNLIFLVDALDECEDTSVLDLLSFFKELCMPRPTISIKICISSRQIPLGILEKCPGFLLEDRTLNDITDWVADKLMEFVSDEEYEFLEGFKREIVKKADGIFLWVELIMDQLRRAFDCGDTVASCRQRLVDLPSELTKLFDEILTKVPSKYHEERDHLLGIVLCCRRPMTLAEIRIAMALSRESSDFSSHRMIESSLDVPRTDIQMKKMVISRCGGLLEVKQPKNVPAVVQFVHQSVRDYLADKEKAMGPDPINHSRLITRGDSCLSKACIRYCVLKELKAVLFRLRPLVGSEHDLVNEIEAISKKYPYLEYGVNYWMHHCERAQYFGDGQMEELSRFENDGAEAFDTWLELYNCYQFGRGLAIDTTLFLMAIKYNLKDFVLQKLREGIDVCFPLEVHGNYLQAAAECGHSEMIQILLAHGAEVNSIGGKYHTALQAAAYSGKKDAVEALLNAKADQNLRGPLYAAAFEGHSEIVDLLLEKGADITSDNGYFRSALLAAAMTGRNSIVRALLNRGADPFACDEFGVNTFFWAVYSSSESTVKVLIENETDIHTVIYPGFTLLHWISLHGSEETVRFLLQNNANAAENDFNGSTPLHWAAPNMHQGVLGALLDAGADPRAENNYGITPLHLAAGQAGIPQVQILLDAGADVLDRDLMGFSIFHFAALNRSADVLRELLNPELDLEFEIEDVFGRKPIHIAAEFGCLASLQLLADRVKDFRDCDFDGGTLLHAAARNESEDAILFCLQRGLDVLISDSAGMTALHHVFRPSSRLPRLTYLPLMDHLRGYTDSIRPNGNRKDQKPKDEAWMSLDLSDKSNSKALATAKVKLLLDKGADIDAQDENGNTALHLACSASNISVIQLLLSRNAKQNLRDCSGFLAIDMANNKEVRELL